MLGLGAWKGGFEQFVVTETVARFDAPRPRALRQLVPQSFHRELNVRHSQQRIHNTAVELHSRILISSDVVAVELLRLPRFKPLFDLLGKTLGIGSSVESFNAENPRGLMMSVPVARASLEAA